MKQSKLYVYKYGLEGQKHMNWVIVLVFLDYLIGE
jgi:hypothetical protein